MANTALTEYLQFHGQQGASGCLQVGTPQEQGNIYLQHGRIVHAESSTSSGLCTLFTLLGAPEMKIDWIEGRQTPKISFDEGVDTLLFQYAQLEDSGQTDAQSLQAIFGGVEKPGDSIRLTELSSYRITFEVLNADLSGIIFHLEKEVTLVGRKSDCDVVIPDNTVSSYHCNIVLESNCVRVIDLGSTNGTRINSVLISDSIIQVNDELWVGNVSLRMSMQMQRHLALRSDQKTPGETNKEINRKSTTVKIDAAALRGQKKGPIKWDNIDENPSHAEKSKTVSLLSKFFKK